MCATISRNRREQFIPVPFFGICFATLSLNVTKEIKRGVEWYLMLLIAMR